MRMCVASLVFLFVLSKMPLFGFEILETNSGSLTDLLTLTLIKRRERES